MKITPDERRAMIVDALKKGPLSCNSIAHEVWDDWEGPPGKGSHPLIRVTGRMLKAMEKQKLVMSKWSEFDQKMIWCLRVKMKP